MRDLLFSLQTKLIVSFAVVTLFGLAVAGIVFVAVQRDEQEEQAVEHVIATSPAVYSEFTFLQRRGGAPAELIAFVDEAAEEHDLRILLVDRGDGTVVADSGDELAGDQVITREDVRTSLEQPVRGQPYVSWRTDSRGPAGDLTFLTAATRVGGGPPLAEESYWLVLAVPDSTIRGAWRDLLPALIVASAIALPIAVGLALLVSAYVTRPLHELTAASQRMAGGNFDVTVSVDRGDEVGRLARAFSTMAERVGATHTQMRQLVANVSHDLKTPLTSILGFAQALRDGRAGGDVDTKHMGGVIYEEASRLTQRLNDLLYLSELESGQMLVEREEIDVGRLVRQVAGRIEEQAADRNLSVALEIADGTVVSADGAKVERAVENLVHNASKYAPEGSTVRVRVVAEPEGVRIEVANPAPDVSEEELPRLFERFYRRDRSRAGEAGADGSGLGLSIARDLVELHGGTLDAALLDGQLVFTVRLLRAAA